MLCGVRWIMLIVNDSVLTVVSESRQVPFLHCCARWHDVKHCVENCLHCGWGGGGGVYCYDASLCKRQKMGFSDVDNVQNGLYSHGCSVRVRHLSDRCPNAAADNVSHEIPFFCFGVENFSQGSAGLNPIRHFPGHRRQGWLHLCTWTFFKTVLIKRMNPLTLRAAAYYES